MAQESARGALKFPENEEWVSLYNLDQHIKRRHWLVGVLGLLMSIGGVCAVQLSELGAPPERWLVIATIIAMLVYGAWFTLFTFDRRYVAAAMAKLEKDLAAGPTVRVDR